MAADVSQAPGGAGGAGGRGRRFPPWFWWALAGGGGAIVLLVLAMRGTGAAAPGSTTTSDQGGAAATDVANLLNQDVSQSQQLAAGVTAAAQAEIGVEQQLQQQLSAFQQQFQSTLPLLGTTRGALSQFAGSEFDRLVPIRRGTSGSSAELRTVGVDQPVQLAGPPVPGQSNFAGGTGPGGLQGSTWWYPVVGGGFISAFDLGQIFSGRQASSVGQTAVGA